MRKLVYDIIENGKVVRTTSDFEEVRGTDNYKTRFETVREKSTFDRSRCKKSAAWLAAHPAI